VPADAGRKRPSLAWICDHHIAHVDADPELDAAVLRYSSVALGHADLHLVRAAQRIHHTAELDQKKPRRVVAKVEWHPGELYPRVGFIVTNLARPAERIVAFYNQRGTAEQWIKEGKGAIKWTRLSCRTFAANAVRLQLHALAYNLGNFMRTLAMPKAAEPWSLTSLREKLTQLSQLGGSDGV
jgi:DDE family transposase